MTLDARWSRITTPSATVVTVMRFMVTVFVF